MSSLIAHIHTTPYLLVLALWSFHFGKTNLEKFDRNHRFHSVSVSIDFYKMILVHLKSPKVL